jgi:hypothetical protein
MDQRHFDGYDCDLIAVQEDIEIYFAGKGFRVTNFHKGIVYLTQLQKQELGSTCIFIHIVGIPSRFTVSIGRGEVLKDIDETPLSFENIPFSVKLLLGDLRLESDFWTFMSTQVQLHRTAVDVKTRAFSPSQLVQRDRLIVREIEVVYCKYCGAKNVARRASCLHCGGNLH